MPEPADDDYPLDAVRVSQPTVDGIMAGHGDQRYVTITLQATMGPPSPVALIRKGTTIAHADDYAAAELERNVPRLRQGVEVAAVIVRESDEYEWEIQYNTDNVMRRSAASPSVQSIALAAPELASIAASMRSIRWAALVAVWLLIAAAALGALAGFGSAAG